MLSLFNAPFEMLRAASTWVDRAFRTAPAVAEATIIQSMALQLYWKGICKYNDSFLRPSSNALSAFIAAESEKMPGRTPAENFHDYSNLAKSNVRLTTIGAAKALMSMSAMSYKNMGDSFVAWTSTLTGDEQNGLLELARAQERLLRVTIEEYPKAIAEIKTEYGFHFDDGGYRIEAETDRFRLYRVLPRLPGIVADDDRKPVLIIPPYVQGANILAFLPGEQRSYVHCFANQGIPTYIRIVKNIDEEPAVQVMTREDDVLDTRNFCREIVARHKRKLTLNGYCQGGYCALVAILSGELDELVDALITCATPIDGSRSKSLVQYIKGLPERFRDIRYSLKTLPTGNKLVDGRILGWVYKLRKMDVESPFPAFHRDLALFAAQRGPRIRINKTAAAVNHWLTYDQTDIPFDISRMSYDSYTIPIDRDGYLPIRLFGRSMNIRHIQEKKIPWLICIADQDDMVDREASLAALDYIDAEVCVFPKGHVSLATSWSIPTSECALHLRFRLPGKPSESDDQISRGPVCFHLDLESIPMAAKPSAKARRTKRQRSAVQSG